MKEPDNNGQAKKSTKHNKRKQEEISSNKKIVGKRKRESGPELKVVLRKVRKSTRVLPLVLTKSDAYSKGSKNCDTCRINKEDYKIRIEDTRVIGLLVDGVIEKEQSELLENGEDVFEEDRCSDRFEKGEHFKTKAVIQVEVHNLKRSVDHSLQCVLIKLQNVIGDVLVQVCFVKTNNLGSKYRNLNVSLSDLKFLRFEYSNLTDKIIRLFKRPSEKKVKKYDVCVVCLKDKLMMQIAFMTEIVKSGKNLKLVMRNKNIDGCEGECCNRRYPHLHAEINGRPIVLKYSLVTI